MNGISLPPKFIGRRRELREWQNALRSGEKSECLIIGAGGMGKTALAGKLLDSLKRDGYEVFGLSVRPDEEHDWRRSLSELEQLLKDKFLIKQYQTALGEATTIETPDDLDEPPKVTVDESRRAEALFDGLLRQYDRQFVLLIDNLESVQHEKARQVNDPVLASWIEVARRFADRGLKLILTSRWQLPKWGETSLCILGQPVFADYVAFIRELSLPVRFMGNADRVRAAFEQLGGNYRALTFFATAAQGMTLGVEQDFLEKLGQAKEEIQVDMAIGQVYGQLDESQREVLNLMRVYLYPVDILGVKKIASSGYRNLEKIIKSLLAVSLLERFWHEGLESYEYVLSELVSEWLKKKLIPEPELVLRQKGALYFLEQWESRIKTDWQHLFKTEKILHDCKLLSHSTNLILNDIHGELDRSGYHLDLVNVWLPKVMSINHNNSEYGVAVCLLGRQFHSLGWHETAIETLNKALHFQEENHMESEDISATLDNLSLALCEFGSTELALQHNEKSIGLLRNTENKHDLSITLNNKGRILIESNDIKGALEPLLEALGISKNIKSNSGSIYLNIARAYKEQGEYELAISYLRKCFVEMKKIGDGSGLCAANLNLAQVYKAQGKFEYAYPYFEKALKIATECNLNWYIAGIHLTFASALKEKEEYILAIEEFGNAYHAYEAIDGKVNMCDALINMGECYLLKAKIAEAVSSWNHAYSISREINHDEIDYRLNAIESLLIEHFEYPGWGNSMVLHES